MRFCPEAFKQSPAAVAAHLGVNIKEYHEIESAKTLLTKKQARQLGKLFKIKSDYFYEAALQLDLLLAKEEIIKIQNEKIGRLLSLRNLKTTKDGKKKNQQ